MKLSKPSRWLLLYLAERHPLGLSAITALPCWNHEEQPRMIHMRGLVRRGWAREATDGNRPWGRGIGIFYATELGLQIAKTLMEGR